MNMGTKHYIGMSGMRGCLPDYITWNEEHALVVDDLASVHDLGSVKKRELRRDGFITMNLQSGAEYCEIVECTCDDPESHNDT